MEGPPLEEENPSRENNSPNGAGAIRKYVKNWHSLTDNSFILNIIHFGYKINFNNCSSFPCSVNSSVNSIQKRNDIMGQIDRLLLTGAISKVDPHPKQIYSRVFCVKKANGDNRMILDLSKLNKLIHKSSFKMETIENIKVLLEPNDYMVSIDLRDAFLSVPVHNDSKPFLCFKFEGDVFNFNTLPFGMTSSPRIFSKVLRVPIVYLRSLGFKISFYLDDIFIAANSYSLLQSQLSSTLNLLISLGFTPNYEKSNLIPSRTLTHLGFVLNSSSMMISIPNDKITKTKKFADTLLSSATISLRSLSSFIGLVNSFSPAFSLAPLHFRGLQFLLGKYVRNNFQWDFQIYLDKDSLNDLSWWSQCDSLPGSPIFPPSSDLTLSTDASRTGWGGVLSSGQSISGSWHPSDISHHINFLELKAIKLAVAFFLPYISNKHITIYSDNFTSVSYVNRKGGTHSRSLCSLSIDIWNVLSSNNSSCSAIHIPGEKNCEADFYSRRSSYSNEYSLNMQAFCSLISKINFIPTIDLFASSSNHKLARYASWSYDPLAVQSNAFSFKWDTNIYLFPPINLITNCLQKIVSDKVHNALLITPAWPGLVSISTIYSLMSNNPIFISREYLEGPLPTRRPFNLMAWTISSVPAKLEAYQKQRLLTLHKALKDPPCLPTYEVGENFIHSLLKEGHIVELL